MKKEPIGGREPKRPPLKDEDGEFALKLLEILPPGIIVPARVYYQVLKSQELDPSPWLRDESEEKKILEKIDRREVSPARASLCLRARDLLLRSFWFAERHTLSLDEILTVFSLSGIGNEEYTDPIAKIIHDDPDNWSDWEKGYQDQLYRNYIGPRWVLKYIHVGYSVNDFRDLIAKTRQTGGLIDVEKDSRTMLKLDPAQVRKIRQFLRVKRG